jgi:hypothetical protein
LYRQLKDFIATLLREMSSGDAKPINPLFFHQVCGALVKSEENKAMNGDVQEDVSEFMEAVFDKLVSEGESQRISDLFGNSLEQKMCCRKCCEEKTFTDRSDHFSLIIPEEVRKPGSIINQKTLFDRAVQDQSWTSDYVCENCKKICAFEHKKKCPRYCAKPGTLELKESWEGKRLGKSPPYLITPIRRTILREERQTEGRGARKRTWTELVPTKLQTKVELDTGPISMIARDGCSVSYELVAVVEHKGAL